MRARSNISNVDYLLCICRISITIFYLWLCNSAFQHAGNPYYYDSSTGETQWEKPVAAEGAASDTMIEFPSPSPTPSSDADAISVIDDYMVD